MVHIRSVRGAIPCIPFLKKPDGYFIIFIGLYCFIIINMTKEAGSVVLLHIANVVLKHSNI